MSKRPRDQTAEKIASKKARDNAHKAMMEQLEVDLQDTLKQSTVPKDMLERRQRTKNRVESALREHFGQHQITVESIGLDSLGLSLRQAPLELVVVDSSNDGKSLPRPNDPLYHPPSLIQALRNSGVSSKLYSPPNWISPESIERPFALPYTAIINPALELVLLPPNPEHACHLNLLKRYTQRYPFMRDVIGLVYILGTTGSDVVSPPLASRVISYLTMAYYCHKYTNAVQSSADTASPDGPSQFYSHPATVILPDGSLDASPCGQHVFTAPDPASDFVPNRKPASVAYDLLEMLRWWDQLRWDQDVITPTSPLPVPRSFDTESNTKRPWDWKYSPLLLQDPVNPLNNIATLITRIQYTELRRSFRNLQRNLRSGLRLSIARNAMRPLHHFPPVLLQGPGQAEAYSTKSGNDYGAHLSDEMAIYYQRNRPSKNVEIARQRTLNRIRDVIRKWYGPLYQPVLFGSSRYGVSDKGSDLDIVILDKTHPEGVPIGKQQAQPKIYQLNRLAGSLKAVGFVRVITIAGAKVPIIKAADPDTGLNVDININDRLGLYNTELLQHYCELWPKLSNLIYIVKKWSKVRGMNDPARKGGASFSSYCLTLMLVGFLQSHGVLPNLQEISAEGRKLDPNRIVSGYFRVKDTRTSYVKCKIHWYRLSRQEWTPIVDPPLGQAFYAWLSYYAYDHKYDEFAVRVAEGGVVPRRSKEKSSKSTKSTITHERASNPNTVVLQQDVKEEPGDEEVESDPLHEETHEVAVEAITDDIGKIELEKIADEVAGNIHQELYEEETEENQVTRDGYLDEPVRWRNDGLVVSDPFIYQKNCAGSVSKGTVNEFVTLCRETLDTIDGGASLENLLSQKVPRKENKEKRRAKKIQKRQSQELQTSSKAQPTAPIVVDPQEVANTLPIKTNSTSTKASDPATAIQDPS